MDQRGSLQKSLAKEKGGEISDQEMEEFKTLVRDLVARGRCLLCLPESTVDWTETDTGSGIPPERLPHVFDRFSRAADSPGTGLGLAISKAIVDDLRDFVMVCARIGKCPGIDP